MAMRYAHLRTEPQAEVGWDGAWLAVLGTSCNIYVLLLFMKKKIIIAVSIVLLLFLGAFAGYVKGAYDGTKAAKFATSMGYASYIGMHMETALVQYKEADYSNAHEALTQLLEVLRGAVDKADDLLLTEKTLRFDIGLTYARLALLEERQNNNDAMVKYLEESLKYFKSAGYMDFDVEKVRELVLKLDDLD